MTIRFMAKKKNNGDRHKMTGRVLRLRDAMWEALEDLAEYLGSDVTHEIRTAIRERLQQHERWPWPRKPQPDA